MAGMKGRVGSVSLSVIPDVSKFSRQLREQVEKIRQRWNRRPPEFDVAAKLKDGTVEKIRREVEAKLRDVKVDVEATLDKSSFEKAKTELNAAAKAAKAKINVEAELSKASVAKVKAQAEAAFKSVRPKIRVRTELDKLRDARKQVEGDTWWKYVGAVFRPGSLDQLKAAFFKAFPDLKMWIWPQIDTAYLGNLAKTAKAHFQKAWNSSTALKARAEVVAHWRRTDLSKSLTPIKGLVEATWKGSGNSVARRLMTTLGTLTVTMWGVFSATSIGKAIGSVRKAVGAAGAFVFRAGVSLTGSVGRLRRGLTGMLGRVGRGLGVKIPARVTMDLAKAGASLKRSASSLGRGAKDVIGGSLRGFKLGTTLPVRAVWNSRAAQATRSKAGAFAKAMAKRAPKAWNIGFKIAKAPITAMNKLGLNKTILWKLQVKVLEAMRVLKTFASWTKSILSGSMKISMGAMTLGPLITGMGHLSAAAKSIAPSLAPAVGIMSAFAAGAGVAAVALKQSSTYLKDLEGPLKQVQKGIELAFWSKAKAPILENSKKLIGELGPSIYKLSGAMGGVFASIASGAGKASGSFKTILGNATVGFQNLSPAMEKLVQGFARFAAAGSNFFPAFGTWIDNVASKFNAWLDRIEMSNAGGITGWMQNGINAAKLFFKVLGDLMSIFGSVLKAAAAGTQGMSGFANTVANIKAVFKSDEGQKGLTGLFAGINQGASQVAQAIGSLVMTFVNSGPLFGQVIGQWGSIIATGIGTITGILQNPKIQSALLALVQGFGAVVTAVAPAVQTFAVGLAPVFQKLGETMTTLAPAIGQMAGMFAQLAGITFQAIGDLAVQLLPQLVSMMNAILPSLIQVAQAIMPIITQALAQILPFLMQMIQTILPPLMQVIQALLPMFMQIAQALLPPLMQLIQALIPPLMQLIQAILPVLNVIIQAFIAVMQVVINILGAILPPIISALAAIIRGIVPVIQGVGAVFSWLMGVAQAIWNGLVAVIRGAVNILSSVISGAMNVVRTVWNAAWTGIKAIAEGIWNGLVSFFSGAWTAITKPFEWIGNAIKNVFKAAFNFIAKIWNNTVGRISLHVPSWVPGIGGKGFSVPKIPEMAKGGIVTKATLAVVGEGRDHEAVIPLPKLQPMINKAVANAGGGGDEIYYVTVNADLSRMSDVADVVRFVKNAASHRRRMQGVGV